MNKQSTNSKKPFKPVSKKPTVKDTFKEKCLIVPDDPQSLLLETKLREKFEKTFPRQPRFNWVAVLHPQALAQQVVDIILQARRMWCMQSVSLWHSDKRCHYRSNTNAHTCAPHSTWGVDTCVNLGNHLCACLLAS